MTQPSIRLLRTNLKNCPRLGMNCEQIVGSQNLYDTLAETTNNPKVESLPPQEAFGGSRLSRKMSNGHHLSPEFDWPVEF